MNYYARYMADYGSKTAHLSMTEDGAYNRLLDWQYANERAIPDDKEARYRIARAMTVAERKAVDVVYEEFFRHEGWNERAYNEIEDARPKINAARANGKHGGRPRRVPRGTNPKAGSTEPRNNPVGFQNETQDKEKENPPASQGVLTRARSPIPNHQETASEKPSGFSAAGAAKPPDPETVFWRDGLAMLVEAGHDEIASRALLGKCVKALGIEEGLSILLACREAKSGDPKGYIAGAIAKRKREQAAPQQTFMRGAL